MKKFLLLLCLSLLSFTGTKSQISQGNIVTTKEELSNSDQFFILKSNNEYKEFNGFTGSGPLYMQCAETGDIELNLNHVMQLIPYKDGKYLVFWPATNLFLKDSYENYNGFNAWQYSTDDLNEAAIIDFIEIDGDYFEMKYESIIGDTYYIGAEMRDGVYSKMKIFTLEHKEYLENGDYGKGYSLPIAFNWSIYKANVDKSYVQNAMSMQKIAELLLDNIINSARYYAGMYDKYCENNEDELLANKLEEVQDFIKTSSITFDDILQKKEELLSALLNYLPYGVFYYSEHVGEIATSAGFSSYPYVKGTYPETSRSMLTYLQSSIENAQSATLTIEGYEALFSGIEKEIELFESTKITEDIIPEEEDDDEEENIEEDVVCVYLSNGDVDIYALSDIDGDYYTEGNKLYIPLKSGDVEYYTSAEYDSCSRVKPEMPTMTSFKFNNKYNPNLHIDAIAETVSPKMTFNLNAIGKWLTASFTLSDNKAVAYVDTVLQVSKETRQSFKNAVTYNVTYPGYNIIKNVKIQDEIWTEPVVGTQVTDVALTADMLNTNKPSQYSSESLANLLDNNPRTIFHSTWGSANNATLNVNTYITINLPEALDKIQIYYKCRPQTGYNPLIWEIYASNDDNSWKLIETLDYIADNMPRGGSGQEFTSNTINLEAKYSKLKILQTQGEYHNNHFVLSELRIKKVTEETGGEPEKIQDEKYETKRIPYGNKYKVKVNWLTDIQNSVPRIDIDIDGGKFVTSKDYYLNAKFRIIGYGVYDFFEDSVQIKGRGNSSWGRPKNPYRLKFAEKVKPFGLTKGKSWVLLANYQSGSLMANAISMKIGQMASAEYTNHIVPVELYINGEYQGNYMFTEKVGLANNSVDVDEEVGHLLELDSNSDDEYQFYSEYYDLPVYIKEPDLKTANIARRSLIESQFNALCTALYNKQSIDNMVDMDALAKFILANDLSLNQELGHPKSIFLFKENENDEYAKYKFGPIWDFDWGYGYENGHCYCYSGTTSRLLNWNMEYEPGYKFFNDLLNVETFKKYYYKAWVEFINENCIDELADYIDHYYAFAKNSFDNNEYTWGNGFEETDRDRHKQWIEERKNYIYQNLDKYDIEDLIYSITGDVNNNNQVTIHDAALITAYLNGNIHETFSENKADCDNSGSIDNADAQMVAKIVKEGNAPSATYWNNTSQALGYFDTDALTLEVGEENVATLNLISYAKEQYKAMQFDIELPDGVELTKITKSQSIERHNFSFIEKGNNIYRITVYSDDDECFSTSNNALIKMNLYSEDIINEKNRFIKISNAYIVDKECNELIISDYDIAFNQSTGINDINSDILIEGGEYISVTLLEPQKIVIYGVDGRKIREFNAKEGTTRIAIPAGIYMVNGEKVVVR